MATAKETIRLAAMADIHCGLGAPGRLQPLFAQATQAADILVLCGDLTDHGRAEEARILVKELAAARIPVIAVLGNHDYESGQPDQVRRILSEAGVTMLDGETCEVAGIGFAGIKGFAGGFGRALLGFWGEEVIKRFVNEALDEQRKLEAALARLRTPQRIAVLHYAPIRATLEGEAPEIFAFMGTSRLEEPFARYAVTAVFHGHAHHGSPEGRTQGGIPVYNVALPVLRNYFPTNPPFRLLEIDPAAEPPSWPGRA
jgi:Icc-related predicted phosphoesterase